MVTLNAKMIELSSKIFPLISIAEQEDTVIHEVAHLLVDVEYGDVEDVHGWEWSAMAEQVGCRPQAKAPYNYAVAAMSRSKFSPTAPVWRRKRSKRTGQEA